MAVLDDRVEAAGRWLVCAGGQCTPGELGAAEGLNHTQQAAVINALRAGSWVEGPPKSLNLTAAGWARFGALGPGEAGVVLDRVLSGWPPEHHAFITLLVCSIIARHHLGALHPSGHLGFVAIGEPGTGKTSPGLFVCHLFGFDPVEYTVHLPAEISGSVLGRREPVHGGAGYRLVTNPAIGRQFVLLDEYDKADGPTQRRSWPYLSGDLQVVVEGDRHTLRPTPLLTANPPRNGDRHSALHPAAWRRCVVLDTGGMRGREPELGRMLRAFYQAADPRDRLALDRLVPPERLAPEAVQVLDQVATAVTTALTEAGRAALPTVGLELAALGRCAVLGPDADHVGAAVQTFIDYLIVAQTVPGQVHPAWGIDMAAVRELVRDGGQVEQIHAAVLRGRQAADHQHEAAHYTRRAKQQIDQDVTEDGARLHAQLRQLHDALTHGVPPARRADAAALRKVLRQRAEDAGRAGTRATLDDIAALATSPAQRARRLIEEIEQDRASQVWRKAELAAEQRRAVEAAKADRMWRQDQIKLARDQRKADKKQARATLAAVVQALKLPEALYKRNGIRAGEAPPWRKLAEIRIDGQPILTHRPGPPRPPATRFRDHFKASPPGEWRAAGGGPGFTGTQASCRALEAWGDDTRAALAPVLAHLHGYEDQLRAFLGECPRTSRPAIQPASRGYPAEPESRTAVRAATPAIAGLTSLP